MNDTSIEFEILYEKLLMEKTGEERIKMGFSMFQFAVTLIVNSVKNKGISPDTVKKETFCRVYKDNFTECELERILNNIEVRGAV